MNAYPSADHGFYIWPGGCACESLTPCSECLKNDPLAASRMSWGELQYHGTWVTWKLRQKALNNGWRRGDAVRMAVKGNVHALFQDTSNWPADRRHGEVVSIEFNSRDEAEAFAEWLAHS